VAPDVVTLEIIQADLDRDEHQRDVVAMTAAYALDPMGNGGPLPPETLERLVDALRAHPTTLIFLAYVEGRAVGIATCFLGFSTFAARPLVNVHDLAVLPAHRGTGVATRLLEAVETKARQLGCCKLTLEVLEHNERARRLYHRVGFSQMISGAPVSGSLFYGKTLGKTLG